MARNSIAVLSIIFIVVGALEIGVALWAIRLLPGLALALMIIGGLLCILAGVGKS